MTYRAGDVVELIQAQTVGLTGSVPKGTKGVVVREPGLASRGYVVRLDPGGRQVELPAEALRSSAGVPWLGGARSASAAPREGSRGAGERAPRESPPKASPRPTPSSAWRSAETAWHPAEQLSEPRARPTRSAEAASELRRRLGRRPRRAGEGGGRLP